MKIFAPTPGSPDTATDAATESDAFLALHRQALDAIVSLTLELFSETLRSDSQADS